MVEYEHFWCLSMEEKCRYAADVVALHFTLYASAIQFLELQSPTDSAKTAEFYGEPARCIEALFELTFFSCCGASSS